MSRRVKFYPIKMHDLIFFFIIKNNYVAIILYTQSVSRVVNIIASKSCERWSLII